MIPSSSNSIDSLIPVLARQLGRAQPEILPFINILKENWYDTIQSLKTLTPQDYQKMKIPHRVMQVIVQCINSNKAMDQKEEKQKPQEKSSQILDEARMVRLCMNMSERLGHKDNPNRQSRLNILETMLKIIKNIVSDPYEMKFRKLKKSNNLIKKTIVENSCCVNFIKQIGFEELDQTYELKSFKTEYLIFIDEFLENHIIDLKRHMAQHDQKRFIDWQKAQQVQKKPIQNTNQQNMQPIQSDNVKQYFNKEKLSEMKYSDALDKLIEIRAQIMSKPPKDRILKIYHKKYENKNINFDQVTFEQEFSKSQDKMVANYWKEIVENNKKGQGFQSKRKLQFEQLIKQKIHKEALIRVRLPNQMIIEGRFGPLEKLQDVFAFVAKIAIGDMYLFVTPPVKRMGPKELNRTLFDLQAVPMGVFYAGFNDNWFIDKNYSAIIKK